MKKIFILHIMIFCITLCAKADHITGGEIFYTLKSTSGNQCTYSIAVKMYMDCASTRQFPATIIASFFNRSNNVRIKDVPVTLGNIEILQITDNDPCISNPQQVCYRVGYYRFDVTLPTSDAGYIVSAQVFFRVDNLSNLIQGYHTGAMYTAEIPGTSQLPEAPKNSSALFLVNNLIVICEGSDFKYNFAATDVDGDTLRYSFCNAYRADAASFNEALPPQTPPYTSLPYAQQYDGTMPLGSKVKIDANTGLISGIAPATGSYAVAVCVQEIRNGIVIATQRKDLQVKVMPCSRASATLPEKYILCDATPTIQLQNESTSPLIISYYWQINNQRGDTVFKSTAPLSNYLFTDTGVYTIKLSIGAGSQCADTASANAIVYPGFTPDFTAEDLCAGNKSHFKDATTSRYGITNTWLWNFNTTNETDENARVQNPFYAYATTGTKNVQLIVGDSKGCVDTIIKPVIIFDKPKLQLAFRDTIICLPDTLQLYTEGSGNFTWTPYAILTGDNSNSPVVAPQKTTTYYVDVEKDGCINHDSIVVRVTDHVMLQAMRDTIICFNDSVQLNIITDGLKFLWSPAAAFNNNALQTPMAAPLTDTRYTVTASIGKCTAQDNIMVSTVPYPKAAAGNDTAICPEATVQLSGISDGKSFTWLPPASLSNAAVLNPVAAPATTTTYMFYAFDDKGCPKPGTDSVKITVLKELHAFAGKDTAVIINQPLRLSGTGGDTYNWSPSYALSAFNIPNPVAIFTTPSEGIRYRLIASSEGGCPDSAFMNVKVYKSLPAIFVPSGFSPNNDGHNDILRPVAAGIQRIDYFNIYNRWGQLVFTANADGKGWDGTVNGTPQQAGTYVWMVKAVDYNGKPYMQKGTVTIVR